MLINLFNCSQQVKKIWALDHKARRDFIMHFLVKHSEDYKFVKPGSLQRAPYIECHLTCRSSILIKYLPTCHSCLYIPSVYYNCLSTQSDRPQKETMCHNNRYRSNIPALASSQVWRCWWRTSSRIWFKKEFLSSYHVMYKTSYIPNIRR